MTFLRKVEGRCASDDTAFNDRVQSTSGPFGESASFPIGSADGGIATQGR